MVKAAEDGCNCTMVPRDAAGRLGGDGFLLVFVIPVGRLMICTILARPGMGSLTDGFAPYQRAVYFLHAAREAGRFREYDFGHGCLNERSGVCTCTIG